MKKLGILAAALSVLLIAAASAGGIVSAALSPRICVDTPKNNSYLKDTVKVAGWSLNSSGVRQVNVYIDGRLIGRASTGIYRPDVNRVFPGYKGGKYSGYSGTFSTGLSSLRVGNHTLRVTSVGNNGTSISRSINLIKPGPRLCVDTKLNNSPLNDTIHFAGWSLNASGVREVDAYIDGSLIGKAAIGQSRTDVGNIFSSVYQNANQSGFSADIDVTPARYSTGNHTLKIVSVGCDGSSATNTYNLVKHRPILCVDTRLNNTVIGETLNIGGWSLNPSGIREVNIYLDGKLYGGSLTGIARPDVAHYYPYYKDAGISGFNASLSVNIASLAGGNHTVKVESVGNDGSAVSNSFTVIKLAPKIGLDVSADKLYIEDTLSFSGWSVDQSGVKEVEVYLDSSLLGKAQAGISRPEIGTANPDYKDSALSGFSFSASTASVSTGSHTLTVKSIANDGEIYSQNYTITKSSPVMLIDTPSGGQNFMQNITVSGWSVDATGIKQVDVYLDGKLLGKAQSGILRTDVRLHVASMGGYKDADKSGFSYLIDINSVGFGPHTVKVVSTGNDGNTCVREVAITTGNVSISYTNYSISLSTMVQKEMADAPAKQVYNGSSYEWRYAKIQNGQMGYYVYKTINGQRTTVFTASTTQYQAILDAVTDQVNPNYLLNDSSGLGIYEFLKLSYVDGVTASQLNSIFKNQLATKGQVFLDAAKQYNVNPIYLAGHAILETGNGTSNLANGIKVNGVKCYNLFGINATDANPDQNGAQYAYSKGWTSVDKAIYGGASWISSNYINNTSYHQDTLYKMRWNPASPPNHQYATDLSWAYSQTSKIKSCFDLFGNVKLYFDIPVFNN